MGRSQRRRAVLAALILATLVAGAAYSIAVYQGDRLLKQFTVGELKALVQTSFVGDDGKTQQGPALTTVLAAAGATSSGTLAIKGMGLHDDGRLTLPAAQVAGVLIDFNERGTTKLCGPRIAHDDWVRDVTEIHVD
jgi:hypothetical protein